MAAASQAPIGSNALSTIGCRARSRLAASAATVLCAKAGLRARPFFRATSEPLNLDAGCAGIVDNRGRLESGARRRGHQAAIQNDPAGPWLQTARFRHRVGAVVRLAAVARVR